ncbi:hypothetical protein BT67DRAFT_269664 [Trichocladium antarcticum]|uniref:Uncharacterized protein n=1 Tax=Trichocladium antarcticum TaxID=1450529 RepID=A0AAN6UMF9_9PEZI|nr:hypothetical protein BT67DRAFT_269664 [Trichocladium antarcticum]
MDAASCGNGNTMSAARTCRTFMETRAGPAVLFNPVAGCRWGTCRNKQTQRCSESPRHHHPELVGHSGSGPPPFWSSPAAQPRQDIRTGPRHGVEDVWLAAVRPRLLDALGTCGELRQHRASQLHPDELVVQPSRHTPSSAAILQQRRTRFDSWQKVPQRPFSPARQTTACLLDTVE